jgi:hypothetical protein
MAGVMGPLSTQAQQVATINRAVAGSTVMMGLLLLLLLLLHVQEAVR